MSAQCFVKNLPAAAAPVAFVLGRLRSVATPAAAEVATAVEYGLTSVWDYGCCGSYFVTASPDEISKLDNGTVAGWARTGFRFNAYAAPSANSVPVCRFSFDGPRRYLLLDPVGLAWPRMSPVRCRAEKRPPARLIRINLRRNDPIRASADH